MMKNKLLIKAIIPSIDREYDVKIPYNELVWKINKLTIKAIFDMNNIEYDLANDNFVMINKNTGRIYNNNEIVLETDIRNGTEIIFLKEM